MALFRGLLIRSLLLCCTLSVIVIPSTLNLPELHESGIKPVISSWDMLSRIKPDMPPQSKTTMLSDYYGRTDNNTIYPLPDSLVRGAIDAGSKHHHLAFRADDVWLTILAQLNFYLRKHGQDKQVLDNWDNIRPKSTLPHSEWIFAYLGGAMEGEAKRRRKAEWLRDWVHPSFSTTVQLGEMDTLEGIVSDLMMMSSSTLLIEVMEPFPCANGIPSITLLGEQRDWEALLPKVAKLKEFGIQPAQYSINLLPILTRFVETFKNPYSPDIRQFWSSIVTVVPKQLLCNTTSTVTGWINGFHLWDQAGNLLSHDGPATGDARVTLDSITYPWRYTRNLPAAYNSFPMCVFFDKGSGTADLVVGMLGKSITRGAPVDYAMALQKANLTLPAIVTSNYHSILRPLPFQGFYGDRRLPDSACEKEDVFKWPQNPPEGFLVPQDW